MVESGEIIVEEVIDGIIADLRNLKKGKVNIEQKTAIEIIKKASEVFLEQPCCIEIDAPVKICGDIHG